MKSSTGTGTGPGPGLVFLLALISISTSVLPADGRSSSLRLRARKTKATKAQVSVNSPVPVPVPVPVLVPVRASSQSSCTDVPEWTDIAGDGCAWYVDDDGNNCDWHGGERENAGTNGQTANEACCFCGGGQTQTQTQTATGVSGPGPGSSMNDANGQQPGNHDEGTNDGNVQILTESCFNNATFFHGTESKQTCEWINSGKDRILSFCQEEAVRDSCPQVCGLCCIDTPGYKFDLKREGVKKPCQWLTNDNKLARQERYCDDGTISNMCPLSCDTCPAPVPIVNTTNSDSPSSCIDNKYYSMGGRKRTCHWMSMEDERRRLFCPIEDVRNNCPFACGLCCEDDDQYTFKIKRGVEKRCKWLAKKTVRQDRYCDEVIDGMVVSDSCPSACGTCKAPYDEGTSDDNCDEPISPGKGSKGSTSKSPGKGIIEGTKSPKQVSKGKGSKCTTAPATKMPSRSPTVSPSEMPSRSPSASPTAATSVVVFSVDVCSTGCGNFTELEDFNLVKDLIIGYALGNRTTDNISVNINAESSECGTCGSDGRRKRFLQEQNLLSSEIVFEITTSNPDTDTDLFNETTILENLNSNIQNLNEDLVANNGTAISFVSEVEQATKQPTQSPTESPIELPTDPPSPPPQELSTRRFAEQINQFYDVSRNAEQGQDRKELREMLGRTFDNAQDIEDVLINSRDKSVTLTSSSRRLSVVDSEDYYADLPDFVTQDTKDPFKCKCVDCQEDETCGGLWKGKRYPGKADLKAIKIHIVVSHCKSDLDWIPEFTKGYDVASIHVISKCGYSVNGAPETATIEVLPNIGRCDHSYAYYVTTILEQKMKEEEEEDSVVVFLKDDISANNFHQSGYWNDFESMLRLASSDNGFACGIVPGHVEFGQNRFFLSTYHEVETLFEFSMGVYGRNIKGYASDEAGFQSEHKTLGSWYASLGAGASSELVQVCYGGVFAASVSNIKKRNMSVWKAVEKSLSRGNNIQEGHYAERSWASLISTPLQPFQVEALLDKSDGVYLNKNSMHGALLKRPKLYLHVGVEGTSSSELLTESLVGDIEKLKSDGYNVAVHGKWDGGIYGFPNIDRLGSCMWSDINKSLFPEHLKEATICPENVLPDLSEYMKRSVEESQDMVMLNPWLVRPGTAESLGSYFDPAWDVNVVIYYRRYFEWITIMFEEWRQDLFEHSLSPHGIPSTSFRYIDFLREYCKRLFYGKDVNEDGFPVRGLGRAAHDDGIMNAPRKVYSDHFDPTTNFEVEELTDLQEYTYFAAKQYYSHSRFRHGVNIVNYHDIRGPETNFYCHVLHDAHNTCKAAVDREQAISEPLEMKSKQFAQVNPTAPFKAAHALEEIVIAAYTAGRLHFDDTQSRKKFLKQILLWIDMVHSALQERKISIADLPIECLYQFEIDRLLEVSLAYEKALLPGFFASSKGAPHLENEFSKWRFCSADTALILRDPQWNFLFEDALNHAVSEQPKAYIHIGAPKTGSTSIQDTMAMDKSILEQDKYFLAMHGQVTRKGKPNDYIIDNMLVQCDRLGACVWSDEERQIVVEGSGNRNAGVCPDYLPPTFDKFLSKAIAAKSNVVISNEWLNRPTSETGLLNILDGWDPTVVIYYRRFFDWMISAHYQWHFDIGVDTLESLQGKVRLIDFIRMFCGRLFASKVVHSPDDSDLSFADLTDIQEYTYHAWMRYKKVPQYENNIKIVNFHDGHIIKSFYCDVLGAERACKLETERLESNESVKTRSKASTAYVDLAIGLHWKDTQLLTLKLKNEEGHGEPITMQTFTELGDRFKERMAAKGLVEDDLPKECLTKSEQTLLLNVSLAYEKILLPDSYASGGEEATRKHFAKTLANDNLCSVDLERVLTDPKWSFLFEGSSSVSVKV